MATTSSSYGLSVAALQELASSPTKDCSRDNGRNDNGKVNGGYDLSFLYSRESDRFGEGIEHSDSALAAIMGTKRSKSAAARRRNGQTAEQLDTGNVDNSKKPLSKEEIERTLASYNHNPKEEEPLYTTTANEYGRKKPSHATHLAESRARSQKFSNSFQGSMYSNEGLRT